MSPAEEQALLATLRDGKSDLERKLAASVLMTAHSANAVEAAVTEVLEGKVMEAPVIQPTRMLSSLLTNSRMKTARRCPRLHFIKYGLGYRALVDADALKFGTLFHHGLEAWWLAPKAERLERALEALETHATEETDPFERVKTRALMTGYHHRWIDEPYEAIAVEAEFAMPLRNPETGRPSQVWTLGGKLDVTVRDMRDGRQLVVEHKTASEDISPGSEYWRRLRMDGQVSVYYVGADSLGIDVSGCLYDVIGKPGLRPLKATPLESRKLTKDGRPYANQRLDDETPEEFQARLMEDIAADPTKYFQRGEVVRLEAEVEEALFDMWQQGQAIHEANKAQRHPRNPDACKLYGRLCEMFDVCSGVASLDDTTRFRRSENVHPELSAAPVASLERGEK